MNIIFTRHKLTETQESEIPGEKIYLQELAERTIASIEDGRAMLAMIGNASRDDTRIRLYGVIPPILRYILHTSEGCNKSLTTFEAFNVTRAEEGKIPEFHHVCWVETGSYVI